MKVAHIAIKVDDIEAAGEFYERFLGFTDVRQGRVRDHYSRHMTDGSIDVTLIAYDSDESSKRSPCRPTKFFLDGVAVGEGCLETL